MMKKIYFNQKNGRRWKYILCVLPVLIFAVSCVEPPFGQTSVDSVPPPPVSDNVDIVPTSGGAIITYELPANENDISYVKCEYVHNGENYTVRSSVYTNSLIIEGLGSVEPISFTLYVVDHSENVSTGVTKTFTPETPLWQTIFESLEIQADFGGVGITWTNETQTEIGVTVYSQDSTGVLREGATRYFKDRDGEILFGGYDFVETTFAARIIDRWGNISPTKTVTVTPLYEAKLDNANWLEVGLPGDNTSTSNARPLKNCWDGNLAYSSLWHTLEGQFMPFPMYITVDLGETVKFSKMILFPRQRADYFYNSHTFKKFEVWGAENYNHDMPIEYWVDPAHNGYSGWQQDGTWELLGDYEVKRPSGELGNTSSPTGADLEYGWSGYQFNVPYTKKPLRYLRFVIKQTWGNGAMHMAEFYFFGDNGTKPESE
jgi:hypothetical protein